MGVHVFPNGISPKMYAIGRQEFELDYYNVAVQHVSHYITENPVPIAGYIYIYIYIYIERERETVFYKLVIAKFNIEPTVASIKIRTMLRKSLNVK